MQSACLRRLDETAVALRSRRNKSGMNQRTLVKGATSGIGRAVALQLRSRANDDIRRFDADERGGISQRDRADRRLARKPIWD
jgi:hypothetical protein